MKNTIKITKSEFIKMLKDWKHGAQPVSLQYVTKKVMFFVVYNHSIQYNKCFHDNKY